MGQTNIYKECETDALDMIVHETKDDQIDRRAFFSLWVIRVFAKFYHFCVHCLFSSQENNSKQSVAHLLKRNCFNYLGIEIL